MGLPGKSFSQLLWFVVIFKHIYKILNWKYNMTRKLTTIFSLIVIIFGLCGSLASAGGLVFLSTHQKSIVEIQQLTLSVADSLEEIIETMHNSNTAIGHVAETLKTTTDTITYTSEISYDSGQAFQEVAKMVGFEILGFKPLGGAEDYFTVIGHNMVGLSKDLVLVQENLKTNTEDMDRLGQDLAEISVELAAVSENYNQVITSYNAYSLVTAIRYLLIYAVVLNSMFILIGLTLMFLARQASYRNQSISP